MVQSTVKYHRIYILFPNNFKVVYTKQGNSNIYFFVYLLPVCRYPFLSTTTQICVSTSGTGLKEILEYSSVILISKIIDLYYSVPIKFYVPSLFVNILSSISFLIANLMTFVSSLYLSFTQYSLLADYL